MTPEPYTDGRAALLAARRHPLVAEIAGRLAGRCGVGPGARIAAGVSGGADSTALLVALTVLRDRGEIDVIAVHVNHHLRPEAGDEARHVEALGERLGVAVSVRDVHPAAAGGNRAMAARHMRYEALAGAAREAGAGVVAVAQHAGDQLETILMALGRGAGLDGLSGMPWRRRLVGGLVLVRPMLGASRADAEGLCRAAGVTWLEDPTNRDPDTVRGRLRRDVIPVFEHLWPGAAERSAGLADIAGAARELVEREIGRVFGPPDRRTWSREALATLPAPFIAAGLRRAAVALVPAAADDLGQAHLDPAADAVRDAVRRPRRYQWPAGMVLEVEAHRVGVVGGPALVTFSSIAPRAPGDVLRPPGV